LKDEVAKLKDVVLKSQTEQALLKDEFVRFKEEQTSLLQLIHSELIKVRSQPVVQQQVVEKEEKEEKCNYTIASYRTISSAQTYPTFESELEHVINTILLADQKGKSGWWPGKRKEKTARVVSVKGIDGIPKEADLVLLCSFTPTNRVEGKTVMPFYNMLVNSRKIICVVFRFGENSLPAKICDENRRENEAEIINSQSVSYSSTSKGRLGNLLYTDLTQSLIAQIFETLGESVGQNSYKL